MSESTPKPTFSQFWMDPSAWPADTAQNVFFGRAVDLIARAAVPEWQGPEFGILPAPALPLAAAPAHFVRATQLLSEYDPELFAHLTEAGRQLAAARAAEKSKNAEHAAGSVSNSTRGSAAGRPLRAAAMVSPASPYLSPRYYARAQEIAADIGAAGQPYRERAALAEQRITEACATLALRSLFLHSSGAFYYCQEGWWAAERAQRWSRFVTCKIDWCYPLTTPPPNARNPVPQPSWLYVEREGLDAFLTKLGPPAVEAPPLPAWAWRADDTAKVWLDRVEVRAEALRRVGERQARSAYREAIDAMYAEHGGGILATSIGRTLRGDPGLYPPGLIAD